MTQADSAPLEQRSTTTKLAIIVALAVERACLRDMRDLRRRDVAIAQSGPGARHATSAAAAAVASGATALMSFGLAGALDAKLRPGAVVIPERIVTPEPRIVVTDTDWRRRIREALAGKFDIAERPLLSSERVLGDPMLKAEAARVHAAIACDLESAAIGCVAAEAHVPFVALRVVADAAEDCLPQAVEAWVDADGNNRIGPFLRALSNPSQWRPISTLVNRFGVARRTLTAVARHLESADFGLAPASRD